MTSKICLCNVKESLNVFSSVLIDQLWKLKLTTHKIRHKEKNQPFQLVLLNGLICAVKLDLTSEIKTEVLSIK